MSIVSRNVLIVLFCRYKFGEREILASRLHQKFRFSGDTPDDQSECLMRWIFFFLYSICSSVLMGSQNCPVIKCKKTLPKFTHRSRLRKVHGFLKLFSKQKSPFLDLVKGYFLHFHEAENILKIILKNIHFVRLYYLFKMGSFEVKKAV